MEENSGGGFKDLVKLVIHSPALLIAFLVGIALVVYFLVKYGPGSGQSSSTSTTATTGSTTDTSGTPVPQFNGSNWNENGPVVSATSTGQPSTSAVTTPPVNTIPADGSHVPYTDQSGKPTSNVPYLGLLGPNVQVNFQNGTYTENGKQIALPSYVGKLSQGDQGRVWYIDKNTGAQDLLTSGYGAGVTNSGYAPNTPGVNTPPSKSS